MNALWWWIDRWRKSTAYTDMTLEQQGAYRNLLDEAWLRGGALPRDPRILAKASGDPGRWPRLKDVLLKRFFIGRDQCFHNATLDEILKESARRSAKQKAYRERVAVRNGTGNGRGNNPGSPSPSLSVRTKNLPLIPSHGEGTPPESCEYCGATAEQTGRAFEWDHFRPRRAGGSDDPTNRVWACHVCNQAKQARLFRTMDEARAWLHRAYWTSNRQRWIQHRLFAFDGKPPEGFQNPKRRTIRGSTCPHEPQCSSSNACIARTLKERQ